MEEEVFDDALDEYAPVITEREEPTDLPDRIIGYPDEQVRAAQEAAFNEVRAAYPLLSEATVRMMLNFPSEAS